VAGVLTQKTPAAWRDEDRARFEVELTKTARLFNHVEALAFAGSKGKRREPDQDTDDVRIAITTRDAPELERVVRVPAHCRREVDRLETAIQKLIDKSGADAQSAVALAALARVTKRLLT